MYQVILNTRLGRKEIWGTYETLERAEQEAKGWPKNEVKSTEIKKV